MKTKMLLLPLMVVAVGACSSAQFGTRSARRAADAVDPNQLNNSAGGPALDVSSLDANKAAAVNGPKPGGGEVDAKTIELTCDDSQGIVIDVTGSLPPVGTATGTDTSTGKVYDPSQGKGAQPPVKLALGGLDPLSYGAPTKGDVPLDKNGNPIGGKDGGKDGGKPLPQQPPQDVPAAAKVATTVKGRFCPKAASSLTVLFVVDYSGSMGAHVDNYGGPTLPGNDPQINGSCGRLKAAQAIFAKIDAVKQPTDKVQVGMVPFAGGIVTNRVIQLMDYDAFKALVSKDTFCQYVVQDSSFGLDPSNPGGIDGTALGVNAATNYQAAFTAAQSLLASVYGRKDLYFLSDGEPTLPGDGGSASNTAVSASIAAGAALRANVDNLTFNGLLLANAELGTHAQDILAQVAGSPDRVRLAADAAALAAEIIKFPDGSIDESTGQATLTVAPYPKADLGLQYLQQDPANPGQWIYLTKSFDLLGQPGQTVLNLVEVTAQGKDGTTYKATIQINYKQ